MLTDPNPKPQRVAVFARVSSEEQAQSGTIDNQVDFARKHCDLHGLEIVSTCTPHRRRAA
jgi:DNA invertase Pin-like site-specific DNA recombinase